MNQRLFIMVCRHFAYTDTIDKILPFQEEFEQMMDDIPYYSRQLYNKFHGLLIPFRIDRLSVTDNYDPNDPNLFAEEATRTYLQRLNGMQRRLSIIHQRVQPQYTHTHPFARITEDFQQSFADDGIYSFSLFLVHNSGPCMPLTVPKLRDFLLHHGILGRMQIHEQWPDLTNKQFNYQELSATLYFLYTNKLNPKFYRGYILRSVLPKNLAS